MFIHNKAQLVRYTLIYASLPSLPITILAGLLEGEDVSALLLAGGGGGSAGGDAGAAGGDAAAAAEPEPEPEEEEEEEEADMGFSLFD